MDCGFIRGDSVLVWLVLRHVWDRVSKSRKGSLHILWHRKVDFAFLAVPVHSDTNIPFSFPVFFNFVFFLV
jgi:hypothetical protein